MRNSKPTRPRRPTLKDKKREETRAKLIAAAKRLFKEHGYDDVPVTEIAQEAGVTHSMINVYFGGKPGLLYEIVRQNNAPQYDASLRIAQGDAPALDRLSDLLLMWTQQDASDPRLLAIMQSYSWVWPPETEQENATERALFKDLIADLLQQGNEVGTVGKKIDPYTASRAIFAIYTWGLRAAVFEGLSPDECHERTMRQVTQLLT